MSAPFSGLYTPLPDINAYLDRIGYSGQVEVSFPCLCKLVACQLDSVPFENLSVFHGHIEPPLDTEALFQKIVKEKRGGYCFELNGLFGRLLNALGFSCRFAAARLLLGRDYLTPKAHMVLLVDLDGDAYFCDVGFGGPAPASPIKMSSDTVFCAAGRRYRFDRTPKRTTLYIERDGSFLPMMCFDEDGCDLVEFIPLNSFCALSKHEPFLHKQMIWRRTKTGKCSVNGDVFSVEAGADKTERKLQTEEELRDVLLTQFGIVYPGPLREWRVTE